MRTKNTLLFTYLILGLLYINCIKLYANNTPIKLLTLNKQFEAGTSIILKFNNSTNSKPLLYINYSYGTTVISPKTEHNMLFYKIPDFVSQKTGRVSWEILNNNIMGAFYIYSKQEVNNIESYLGPPSIEAGTKNYSMLVNIPTDVYDNPLANKTEVTVNHQFLNTLHVKSTITDNRISYTNLHAYNKTGRILIGSSCLNKDTKEFTLNIMPSVPTNFKIFANRHHQYADANQIITIKTSQIKDKYNNIISDGTLVTFIITTNKKTILKTTGLSINGIATAKMIHPNHKDTWQIKAHIAEMATSNYLNLEFNTAISQIKTAFNIEDRIIKVGPLKSFMNQMIPDGIEVHLVLLKNGVKTNTIKKASLNGYVYFKLDTNNVPIDTYTICIKTAGITKSYNAIKI